MEATSKERHAFENGSILIEIWLDLISTLGFFDLWHEEWDSCVLVSQVNAWLVQFKSHLYVQIPNSHSIAHSH